MPVVHAFDTRTAQALPPRIESMRARSLAARGGTRHKHGMTTTLTSPVAIDWDGLYDGFIGQLRARGAGLAAPRVGDTLAPFVLPNSVGRHVALADLLKAGPIVLSFMRGGWCPYCRAELDAWAVAMPRLAAACSRFVAVSGEVGGRAETTRCELAPRAEMLCDIDHGLATALGLSFAITPALHQSYHAHGLELADIYGDSGRILPIPATFVIDRDAVVRFAFVEPDFRIRADPAAVVAAIEALG